MIVIVRSIAAGVLCVLGIWLSMVQFLVESAARLLLEVAAFLDDTVGQIAGAVTVLTSTEDVGRGRRSPCGRRDHRVGQISTRPEGEVGDR